MGVSVLVFHKRYIEMGLGMLYMVEKQDIIYIYGVYVHTSVLRFSHFWEKWHQIDNLSFPIGGPRLPHIAITHGHIKYIRQTDVQQN